MFDIAVRKPFRPTKFKISMNNFSRHAFQSDARWETYRKRRIARREFYWRQAQKEDYLNVHLKEISPFGVKCTELSVCPKNLNAGTLPERCLCTANASFSWKPLRRKSLMQNAAIVNTERSCLHLFLAQFRFDRTLKTTRSEIRTKILHRSAWPLLDILISATECGRERKIKKKRAKE